MTRQTNTGSWFLYYRLDWISEMLDIYGFIQRQHLVKKFRISVPQASLDLKHYQKRHPDSITYNPTTKRYEKVWSWT